MASGGTDPALAPPVAATPSDSSGGTPEGSPPASPPVRARGATLPCGVDSLSPLPAEREARATDFSIVRLLGKGDIGRVYLVRHKATRETYAMKVVDKKDVLRRNKVHRLHTEWSVLQEHDHPFVAKLHWSFQSRTKFYFVMEYCAGGEFFRFLQRQKGSRLPEPAAKFYAAEVLIALEYLHVNGLVYRDIKPENILMNSAGHLLLTDFDLSKKTCPTLRLSSSGPPPSQKSRANSVDPRSAAAAAATPPFEAAGGCVPSASAATTHGAPAGSAPKVTFGASSCPETAAAIGGCCGTGDGDGGGGDGRDGPGGASARQGGAGAALGQRMARSVSDPTGNRRVAGAGAGARSGGGVCGGGCDDDDALVVYFKRKWNVSVVPNVENGCSSFVGTAEYIPPEVLAQQGDTNVHAIDFWGFGILLYEMLYGATPFKGATQAETFRNIRNQAAACADGSSGGGAKEKEKAASAAATAATERLKFPDKPPVSDSAKKLIRALLHPNPVHRLGSKQGAAEVKGHKWFRDTNFTLIRHLAPPLEPLLLPDSPQKTATGGLGFSLGLGGDTPAVGSAASTSTLAAGERAGACAAGRKGKAVASCGTLAATSCEPEVVFLPPPRARPPASPATASAAAEAHEGLLSDSEPDGFGEDPEVRRLLQKLTPADLARIQGPPPVLCGDGGGGVLHERGSTPTTPTDEALAPTPYSHPGLRRGSSGSGGGAAAKGSADAAAADAAPYDPFLHLFRYYEYKLSNSGRKYAQPSLAPPATPTLGCVGFGSDGQGLSDCHSLSPLAEVKSSPLLSDSHSTWHESPAAVPALAPGPGVSFDEGQPCARARSGPMPQALCPVRKDGVAGADDAHTTVSMCARTVSLCDMPAADERSPPRQRSQRTLRSKLASLFK